VPTTARDHTTAAAAATAPGRLHPKNERQWDPLQGIRNLSSTRRRPAARVAGSPQRGDVLLLRPRDRRVVDTETRLPDKPVTTIPKTHHQAPQARHKRTGASSSPSLHASPPGGFACVQALRPLCAVFAAVHVFACANALARAYGLASRTLGAWRAGFAFVLGFENACVGVCERAGACVNVCACARVAARGAAGQEVCADRRGRLCRAWVVCTNYRRCCYNLANMTEQELTPLRALIPMCRYGRAWFVGGRPFPRSGEHDTRDNDER
jgi:hypothetical protein